MVVAASHDPNAVAGREERVGPIFAPAVFAKDLDQSLHLRVVPLGIPTPAAPMRNAEDAARLEVLTQQFKQLGEIAYKQLKEAGVSFRLSAIGETFREMPEVFVWAKEFFADHIDRWGYQQSHSEYESALGEADVVVSTANHEFFGISIVEAVAAGAWPVLPRRLAYPEIVAKIETADVDEFFYDGTVSSLVSRLSELADRIGKGDLWGADSDRGWRGVRHLGWDRLGVELDDALEEAVR